METKGILIQNLHKSFGSSTALEEINLTFPEGKMVALAGPDGAGKTTLLRLLAGLLLPSKGSLSVLGFDTATQADKIHEFIGYMPQKFGVYEDLTVSQNLHLYAQLKGLLKEEKKAVFEKLLHFTGLGPFQQRLSGALSGGMKQKLGLACSLLSKPKVLLLDEPTVGVDPISRKELWSMVQELKAEGITIIWSTAYLDEAQKCDLAVLLSSGKVLFYGAPMELTERVKGRVFHFHTANVSLRSFLTQTLLRQDILDAVIEGDHIRAVVKKGLEHKVSQESNAQPLAPRFEDGFMEILGGGPGGISSLAEKSPKISSEYPIMIEATQLTKRFGSFTAVDNVSFSVKKGEVYGLLGPNGAGKSTTFKMLCGLLLPSSGKTLVSGMDLAKTKGAGRAKIGYMAQKFSLYEGLSLIQNLKIFSGFYNLYGKEQKLIIQEMVEVFDFDKFKDQNVGMLPLGYKQRLALACAVMHHPQVVFLDEPTSGVDPIVRREFWNHINGLVHKGTTIILTTHFMDEAENCDRIALIYGGKVINEGAPQALKEQAKSQANQNPTLEDAFIALITKQQEATQ
jgi:ABC-2 type transport system ATP-binding protein